MFFFLELLLCYVKCVVFLIYFGMWFGFFVVGRLKIFLVVKFFKLSEMEEFFVIVVEMEKVDIEEYKELIS